MTRSLPSARTFHRALTMLTAAAAGFFAATAHADDFFWNNPDTWGAFEDQANWNDGASGIPGPQDVAIFDISGSPKITFTAHQMTDRLIIRTSKVKLVCPAYPVVYTLLNPVGVTESIVIGQGGRDLTQVLVTDLTLRGAFATIGKLFDANGTLELYGASALELDSHLRIGDEGVGRLKLYPDSTLACGACEIGRAALSHGQLWLAGASASCAGPLTIGKHGDGEMIVDAYAVDPTLDSGDVIIAQLADSIGIATLQNAFWTISGSLDVGMNSYGRLELRYVDLTNEIFATIGTYAHYDPWSPGEGIGDVILEDASWSVYGDLYVGYLGQGNLAIDAGSLSVDQDIYVGAFDDAVGTLEINGGDVLADGDFFLGVEAVGQTSLTASAVIDVAQNFIVGPDGSLSVSSGTAIAGQSFSIHGTCTVDGPGLISAGFDVELAPGAALTLSSGGAIVAGGDLLDTGGEQCLLQLAGAQDYIEPAIDVSGNAEPLHVIVTIVDEFFKPADGDTFAVVHADGLAGAFTFDLPELDEGLAWEIITTPHDIALAVYSYVPGDATGDGIVDVLDLLAVLNAWGDCPGCPEDLTGDGVVDVLDLLQVLANWTTNP